MWIKPGASPEYLQAAKQLGYTLASKNIGLVYGGAKVGMMGRIAEAVLEKKGEVIGVIPKGLVEKEVSFTGLADLRVVDSMHERKAIMADLSDGFIALPGGLGTLEEFFEVATWAQLGIHPKPCGLLNVRQYYNQLMDFLDHTVKENLSSWHIVPCFYWMRILSDYYKNLKRITHQSLIRQNGFYGNLRIIDIRGEIYDNYHVMFVTFIN